MRASALQCVYLCMCEFTVSVNVHVVCVCDSYSGNCAIVVMQKGCSPAALKPAAVQRASQQGGVTHMKQVAVIFRLMSAIGNNKTLFLRLSRRRQLSVWQRKIWLLSKSSLTFRGCVQRLQKVCWPIRPVSGQMKFYGYLVKPQLQGKVQTAGNICKFCEEYCIKYLQICQFPKNTQLTFRVILQDVWRAVRLIKTFSVAVNRTLAFSDKGMGERVSEEMNKYEVTGFPPALCFRNQ